MEFDYKTDFYKLVFIYEEKKHIKINMLTKLGPDIRSEGDKD